MRRARACWAWCPPPPPPACRTTTAAGTPCSGIFAAARASLRLPPWSRRAAKALLEKQVGWRPQQLTTGATCAALQEGWSRLALRGNETPIIPGLLLIGALVTYYVSLRA